MEYIQDITERIAIAADNAAAEYNADIKQMLTSSAVFAGGMLFSNYGHNAGVLEQALQAHSQTVRNVVESMVKNQLAENAGLN